MCTPKSANIVIVAMVGLFIVGILANSSYAMVAPGTAVGVWLFDEDEGDVARDSSKNGNDGTILGGEWVDGKFGKALKFNGIAPTGVTVEDSASQLLKDQMTVVAWVNASSNASATIIRKGIYNAAGGTKGWAIDIGSASGSFRKFVYLESGLQIFDGPTKPEIEEWQHLAFTYDGTEFKAYLNGEVYGTTVASGDLTESQEPIGIGINSTRAHAFAGIIDEVGVFNKALTESDIKGIMTEGLDMMLGITAVDLSGKLTTTWAGIKVQ